MKIHSHLLNFLTWLWVDARMNYPEFVQKVGEAVISTKGRLPDLK